MDYNSGSEAEASTSAPTSTKPMFKKKARGRGAQKVTSEEPRPSVEREQDGPAGGRHDGDDDEDDPSAELSVADLIALRNLSRKPTGIELDKLNKGLKKKKKTKKKSSTSEEDRWKEQMAKGGLVKPGEMSGRGGDGGAITSTNRGGDSDSDSDGDDSAAAAAASRAKRRVRADNFQGETNVIDVDKHMMAYIESEMLKRRGGGADDSNNSSVSRDVAAVLANPEDELYKVAEKYTRLQSEARNAATANRLISNKSRGPDDEDGEGSVGLSSAMLSGIPEVELGMDSRLKNIEETEKAKRALQEQRALQRRQRGGMDDREADDLLANARFFNPRSRLQSDAQVIAEAKKRAQEEQDRKNGTDEGSGQRDQPPPPRRATGKREMATDDQVMQRFKKRQMNNMKR